MLDIQYIRNNIERIKENCKNRNVNVDVDKLIVVDDERRKLIEGIEQLRAQRNKGSKGKPSPEQIAEMRTVGEEIKEREKTLVNVQQQFKEMMEALPNITHADAPVGPDESANTVVRAWGQKPQFSFSPREHWEIGEMLGIIDKKKAAEVSGSRFAYLKGDLALLEFALVQFTMSVLTSEKILSKIATAAGLRVSSKPFTPVIPPVMIRPEVMQQMGRLEPKEERYHIPGDDLYLVGSAEHTLGPLHRGETIDREQTPIRYIGFSAAFRREAGSYGKDTKGIFRVHQFDKLEMESFVHPEDGLVEHDFIIAIQEYLMQQLGIPYQVVYKCTGDMGQPDYREFDIEAWMPGQGKYRETHTADYMTDFQARRLGIKVADADGSTPYAHMNDATAIVMSRIPVAILENYQHEDGTVTVPPVLIPYMHGKKLIGNID